MIIRPSMKPWKLWRPRGRKSDAQLMAAVHTCWWWLPWVNRRYR